MPALTGIEGLERAVKKIGALQTTRHLRKPMLQSLAMLESGMAATPPKPTNSKYIRTGNYAAGWNIKPVKATKTGIEGTLATGIDYAPWVGSQTFQARIHRGRWGTDRIIIRNRLDRILTLFNRSIREVLQRRR